MITGPLFKWFGSKWLSSKTLPFPKYDTIIEPFAGGAGYSLRHCSKRVILYEKNDHLIKLWNWLIHCATDRDILDIPTNIPIGTDIRLIGMSLGQELLLKNWQRTNNVGNCWTISPWGNSPGQWTENTRARVADEIQYIKHWAIADNNPLYNQAYHGRQFTWFVDPPYLYNYDYKQPMLDYGELSDNVQRVKGQIVVCEAICPKTQRVPDYLPFKYWASRITSRRKAENSHHSKELIYEAEQ